MRSTLMFSTLRMLILVVVWFVLLRAGARGWLLLGLTVLISAVLSYFLLARQRAAMANDISARVGRFRRRLGAGTRAEDDD